MQILRRRLLAYLFHLTLIREGLEKVSWGRSSGGGLRAAHSQQAQSNQPMNVTLLSEGHVRGPAACLDLLLSS